MRIAFGIVRLFPEGGLQRDCIALARLLMDRGHEVTIFTARNLCDLLTGPPVISLQVSARTNHGTDLAFARQFEAAVAGRFDRVVGFNKLIGLDVLYCADPPVQERRRMWWHRILPRYRTRLRLEEESFGPGASTRIIAVARSLAESYQRHWGLGGLGADRFTIMPAGVDPARRRPELRQPDQRRVLRDAFDLAAGQTVWLWIGAKPHTKGLDRVLAAMPQASSPQASSPVVLLVVGVSPDQGDGLKAARRARRLGLSDRVRFLGYREDIAQLMAVADVLVHPARLDVTGQVILEAVVNGLPVIASACCGFAEHVRAAEAGIVLPEPFAASDLKAAAGRLNEPALAETYSKNGIAYGPRVGPVGLSVAADVIMGMPAPSVPGPTNDPC